MVLAVFGLLVAIVWWFVQGRSAERIRFRLRLLQEIERHIEDLPSYARSFTNWSLLRTRGGGFEMSEAPFIIKKRFDLSSTRAEQLVPVLTCLLWIAVLSWGIAVLV